MEVSLSQNFFTVKEGGACTEMNISMAGCLVESLDPEEGREQHNRVRRRAFSKGLTTLLALLRLSVRDRQSS